MSETQSVYHPLARTYVSKSSPAGQILSNPANQRCKGGKVINPKTQRCVDPTGPTMRPLLLSPTVPKEEKKTPAAAVPKKQQEHDDLQRKRYVQAQNKRLDPAERLRMNAMIAVHRLHARWAKGALRTDAQMRQARDDFDHLQRYARTVQQSRGAFYRALTRLQRMEYEDATRVASAQDFAIVMARLRGEEEAPPEDTFAKVARRFAVPNWANAADEELSPLPPGRRVSGGVLSRRGAVSNTRTARPGRRDPRAPRYR